MIAAALVAVVAGSISVFRNSWQAAPGMLAALIILGVLAIPARSPGWPVRWSRRLLTAVAVVFTAASVALFYFLPIFALPTPDGPNAIGTRQFELIDSARTGLMEDEPGTPRRIIVRAWYPASSIDGLKTRPYLTPEEVNDHAIDVFSDFGLPHIMYRHFSLVRTHSYMNAPVDVSQSLPVVVFSHGYWCWPGQNTALMEKLASHGYLVFSIGHPYDGGTMTFSDGVKIPVSPKKKSAQVPTEGMLAYWRGADHEARYAALRQYQLDFDQHRVMKSFNAWRGDLKFFLDELTRGELPGNVRELQQVADHERIGFAGMSFGGTSSASACHHDERCKAAVNLDGEEFDWSLYDAPVRMPLTVLHADWVRYPPFGPSSADPTFNIACGYAYESWEHAGESSNVIRGRLIGARHLGLTDLPLSARGALRARMYGSGDPESVVDATNALVLGFFEAQLKSPGPNQFEARAQFPSAVFEQHPSTLAPHRDISVREWWTSRSAD
jgi:predicted dienelactone hydrolase